MTVWRPISLMNVIYKIGSSCIANRVQIILPTLIDDDQTGFISNSYIGDNVSLIYDLINYLNRNFFSLQDCCCAQTSKTRSIPWIGVSCSKFLDLLVSETIFADR